MIFIYIPENEGKLMKLNSIKKQYSKPPAPQKMYILSRKTEASENASFHLNFAIWWERREIIRYTFFVKSQHL